MNTMTEDNVMKTLLRNTAIIALISFALNYAWEYWQCSIFYVMPSESIPSLMISATVGDVLLSVALYIIIALADKDLDWILFRWSFREYAVMILYSLSSSFYFESNALYTHRWSYSDAMPLFFSTNIGLVPVLQLLILFPLAFLIGRIVVHRIAH
jgi:hypothetical protein